VKPTPDADDYAGLAPREIVAECPRCHRPYVWVPKGGPHPGGWCVTCECALVPAARTREEEEKP
jgi:hypothetical protein